MNLKKINNPFGGLTFYKESTISTMLDAKSMMADENIDGSIIITDYQSGGVGRIPGRKWFSNPGDNLTFTLVLSMDYIGRGYGTIPLRAGLALSKTISELTECETKVKWPNDVVVNDKKISGILCQTKGRSILIGIGINVNQLEFDPSLEESATSFSQLTNNGYNLEMVLSNFLNNFKTVIESDSWLEELNRTLYKQGDAVTFAIGNPETGKRINGTLKGLDKMGKVIIITEDGSESSHLSGEFI